MSSKCAFGEEDQTGTHRTSAQMNPQNHHSSDMIDRLHWRHCNALVQSQHQLPTDRYLKGRKYIYSSYRQYLRASGASAALRFCIWLSHLHVTFSVLFTSPRMPQESGLRPTSARSIVQLKTVSQQASYFDTSRSITIRTARFGIATRPD